jgi:CRP-like cAMP-binding protein/class 3 adenylate cyclase/TolB-like protein/Flp pilus assembly protein TadD
MQNKIRQVMGNSHLFEGLRPDLIDEVASSATRKTISAGEVLFQKGDPADALWGVLSGRIVIEVATDDGKEMVLDAFGKGDVFGEVGVIDFGPRRVEARATEESELFRLERKYFLKYLQSSPELCFRVFSLLCSNLRQTTENLEETALHKLPDRLAKRLTILADESPANDDAVLHIVQSDLASMLGVNREAVNRHLKVFEKDGLIALRRQRIEILDRQALAELASLGQTGHHDAWGNENLLALKRSVFAFSHLQEHIPTQQERHSAGLMAIDAAEYSRSLMTDAAGTLKRIEAGLNAVEQAIEKYQGHTVWHTGDRVLAEFPDAQLAMQAALAIQEQVTPAARTDKNKRDSLFRIGVHHGEVLAGDNRFLGESVNTVIRLTQLSGAGGITISGAVRDALENREGLELQFLGDHELRNVSATVPVYSARAIPIFKMLALRAETLVPRRFRPAAVAVAVIMLLAGTWFTGDRMGQQNAPLAVSQLSIAVLPFTTNGNTALDYLAQGLPEEVRASLSTIPGVRVIGRESSGYFNDRKASAREIGRALEVAWLLRGSLTNADDETHTTTQLLNAVNDEVVWEEQFQTSQEYPVALGPDIAHRIAVSLGIIDDDGTGLPQVLPLTNNTEAQVLYLEAQSHIWRGRQRYAIKAIPLLQAAIEMDPSFAEAHAVLAVLYLQMDMLDKQQAYNPGLRRELARQSLQKALSLKPDSPLVLAKAAQTRVFDDDHEGALALAERALRIDPNNTDALRARSWVESNQQDLVGLLQTSEQLIKLEPLSVSAINNRIGQLMLADRYQQALVIANRTFAFYPENEVPFIHAGVAQAKLNLGDRLGAIIASRKGMPYGAPIDLWTGLEYDWDFFDDLDPVRSAVGLVYVEEYDRVRQILIENWDAEEPDSAGANDLEYLVNRGELEALAGGFETSIEFFERARLLMLDEGGGLVRAEVGYNVLDWSRQSHWSLALLFAYRKSGQHDKAEIIAEQFEELVAEHREAIATVSDLADYQYLYKEAQYYAMEGRRTEALDKLRTWVDYGVYIYTYIKWDPFLESLRGDPEFEAIVAEVEAELAEVRSQYHLMQAAAEN